MTHQYTLGSFLALDSVDQQRLKEIAAELGLTAKRLSAYLSGEILPPWNVLDSLCKVAGKSPLEALLYLGQIDRRLIEALRSRASEVAGLLEGALPVEKERTPPQPAFETDLGKLYHADCLDLMAGMSAESVDMIFADPPFNLKKFYPSLIDDDLREDKYLEWCEDWLSECVRILKPGGSLFVWNLPKWSSYYASFLNRKLTFRHWISVSMKYSLPIANRLYPAHYSLLYYCKGEKPSSFHPDRMPMETCPSCHGDLRDYGGYKDRMNPSGVNMSDVWTDFSPVRHSKYKKRVEANELPVKLLDRVITMSTKEGDIVFDPFGGSGTTYVVAQLKGRRWIGSEVGPIEGIVERITNAEAESRHLNEVRAKYNRLFPEDVRKSRLEKGLWTCETVRAPNRQKIRKNAIEQESLF